MLEMMRRGHKTDLKSWIPPPDTNTFHSIFSPRGGRSWLSGKCVGATSRTSRMATGLSSVQCMAGIFQLQLSGPKLPTWYSEAAETRVPKDALN